jgi:hypothetical protein
MVWQEWAAMISDFVQLVRFAMPVLLASQVNKNCLISGQAFESAKPHGTLDPDHNRSGVPTKFAVYSAKTPQRGYGHYGGNLCQVRVWSPVRPFVLDYSGLGLWF